MIPTFMIPADQDAWQRRMSDGVRAFETVLDTHLDQAHGGTKFNATRFAVPDLAKYLKSKLKTKTRPVSLCTGRGYQRVNGQFTNLDYHTFGGSMYLDQPLYAAGYSHPDLSPEKHEELLTKVGDALGAHSASYSPLSTWSRHRLAHWCFSFGRDTFYEHDLPDRTAAEARLPKILESSYTGLEHVLQPQYIGWINYWSAEVCEYLDFPNALEGSPILDLCYRTARKAWIVKLSEPPLDSSDVHTDILREMYERFPRAGVRVKAEYLHLWQRQDGTGPPA